MRDLPDLLGRHRGSLILDCDEVMLNWRPHFLDWARETMKIDEAPVHYGFASWNGMSPLEVKEMIRRFNEEENTGFEALSPLEGAVDAISALHASGCSFRVLTSCSGDPAAMRRREANIISTFGDVFDEIVCIPLWESKLPELSRHDPSVFLDDTPANVENGAMAGHSSLLMAALHNHALLPQLAGRMTIVKDWRDFMARIPLPGVAAAPADIGAQSTGNC